MAKLRVYELAEQMNKTNKEILSILKDKGIEVASHMSTLSDEQIDAVKSEKTSEDTPKKKNIVQVFRPQNSQGGGRGRNGQGRPQGSRNGQRPQGNGKTVRPDFSSKREVPCGTFCIHQLSSRLFCATGRAHRPGAGKQRNQMLVCPPGCAIQICGGHCARH